MQEKFPPPAEYPQSEPEKPEEEIDKQIDPSTGEPYQDIKETPPLPQP